jgi:hypothetical protein
METPCSGNITACFASTLQGCRHSVAELVPMGYKLWAAGDPPTLLQSSEILCRMDLYTDTNASEKLTASIFRIVFMTTLNIEAAGSSETLVRTLQSTRRQIPEDWTLHQHHPNNLRFHNNYPHVPCKTKNIKL